MPELLKKLESEDVHVVVVPYETKDHHKSECPIVMETMITHSTISDAVKQKARFACYGDGIICKLVPLTREEIRAAIKS